MTTIAATPTAGEQEATDAMIEELATQFRTRSIRMADRAGSGHPTSAMSAADLVAVLTARHLEVDPERPDALGNDRLLFSKGHASPLLYAALEAIGILDPILGDIDIVDAYRRSGSPLEGHPTPIVPGVPAATGSLGLGLSIAVGLATAHRMSELSDAHVWVLCGDGELAEGANWEAIEHAGAVALAGMTAIVDVNRLGQSGSTRHGWDLDAYARRFEAFGWRAITIDGHDLGEIDQALGRARESDEPVAVIARTIKGRGASETSDEEGKHGKPLDDPDRALEELGRDADEPTLRVATDRPEPAAPPHRTDDRTPTVPTWSLDDELATRDAFGEALVEIGGSRPDVVVLDGEVKNSTRVASFSERYPDRFVEAYIAEQLMCGAAIGLAASGWRPFVTTFGAFLTRAHDVLRMAAISRSDIAVVGSHAGVSIGPDGPSQMALEDLAMMRCLPGSTVLSPCDANQAAALTVQMLDLPGLSYLRTMRGDTPVIHPPDRQFHVGGSFPVRRYDEARVTVLATGVTVHEAIEASNHLGEGGMLVDVIDVYSIKPIDAAAIERAAATSELLVVVEDHRPEGGLGDAVSSVLTAIGSETTTVHLAVDTIPGSATPAEQRAVAGIDADAIATAILDALDRAH